jgi:hypothetical protein
MKKILLSFLVATLFFVACSDSDDGDGETYYYYEMGKMPTTDYNDVAMVYPISGLSAMTATQIQACRTLVKTKAITDFESGTDCPRSELRTFFITHGFAPNEADALIKVLDQGGNAILFFNDADSLSYKWYMYLQHL